jgi:hypothetical protein
VLRRVLTTWVSHVACHQDDGVIQTPKDLEEWNQGIPDSME